MSLNVNVSNIWKNITNLSVNVGGVWKQCVDAYLNVNGVWKSVLYATGTQNYTAPGTYSFVVPAGVTSLTATIVGGGGGGGGTLGPGDNHAGGSGGSGGKYVGVTVAVIPGETLTVNVGAYGLGGIFNFNTSNWFETPNSGQYYGSAGGASSIYRGATALYVAGGGGGGLNSGSAGNGDVWNGASGGAAGSPNGTAGVPGPSQRNNYVAAIGATNGTGYGSGGNSNYNTTPVGGPLIPPTHGDTGAVLLSW
jgi:hypothetical protein